MLREMLEAGKDIPQDTNRNNLLFLMMLMIRELSQKMQESYTWLASCTVAVEAGRWGGERRRRRRLKLAHMIAKCAEFLGMPDPTQVLPKGWEMNGLTYGYGAFGQVQSATGLSIEELVLLCPRTVTGPDGEKIQTCFAEQYEKALQEKPTTEGTSTPEK